jgi:hypothetical protein
MVLQMRGTVSAASPWDVMGRSRSSCSNVICDFTYNPNEKRKENKYKAKKHKTKNSIGVLYYLRARMVLQMRGTVSAASPWDVMVRMQLWLFQF